jgi:DNA repair exonuclease SbcCD ATPase subunit
MKATTLENDLKTAKDELQALQAELPNFHTLLTDNEQDAQRLKSERASLDAQAQARGRVNVAREMLEQHQADIQTARAEVARLESLVGREVTLAKMAEHARCATKHGRELETAVHEGSKALGAALATIAASFDRLREERTAFALLGRELVPEFDSKTPFGNSVPGNKQRAEAVALASELEAMGVNLSHVLNSATGWYSGIDSETRPLPSPEHADLLWKVLAETDARQNAWRYAGVYLPLKPHLR